MKIKNKILKRKPDDRMLKLAHYYHVNFNIDIDTMIELLDMMEDDNFLSDRGSSFKFAFEKLYYQEK